MRRVFYHQVVRLPSRTYTNHNPGPPSEPGYAFLREMPGAFLRFTITTTTEDDFLPVCRHYHKRLHKDIKRPSKPWDAYKRIDTVCCIDIIVKVLL